MKRYKTKTGLPDAIERREILAGNRPDVDLDALGEAYLEAGWLTYAVDCFEKSGNRERLEHIRSLCLEGDPFLLPRLAELVGVSEQQWRAAAERLAREGRHHDAARCFTHAGDEERAAEQREIAAAFLAEVRRERGERSGETPGAEGDGAGAS